MSICRSIQKATYCLTSITILLGISWGYHRRNQRLLGRRIYFGFNCWHLCLLLTTTRTRLKIKIWIVHSKKLSFCSFVVSGEQSQYPTPRESSQVSCPTAPAKAIRVGGSHRQYRRAMSLPYLTCPPILPTILLTQGIIGLYTTRSVRHISLHTRCSLTLPACFDNVLVRLYLIFFIVQRLE